METWGGLLRLVSLSRAVELLQYNDITYDTLAAAFPQSLAPFLEFSQRLKIEGRSESDVLMEKGS